MQYTKASGLIVGFLLICFGSALLASEADELREKARAVRKEAAVLAEQGKKDESQRLEQEIAKLLQAANERDQQGKADGHKQGGADEAVRSLGQRLGDLLAKERKMRETNAAEAALTEVRNQIASTERELKQAQSILATQSERRHAEHAQGKHQPENCPPEEQLQLASRRIHHVRVAAENLKLADMPDLSRQLGERAEAMERELREARQRFEAQALEAQRQRADQSPEVRQLREEVERLRAELKGLRQSIEKR